MIVTTERKPTRFEIRLPPTLGDQIDSWRRDQPDLPTRAEAARRLIEHALAAYNRYLVELANMPYDPPPHPGRKRRLVMPVIKPDK